MEERKDKEIEGVEKEKWWLNEDGTLKCFGKAEEYSLQSFHCLHLLEGGDCNEALKKQCWKLTGDTDWEEDIKRMHRDLLYIGYGLSIRAERLQSDDFHTALDLINQALKMLNDLKDKADKYLEFEKRVVSERSASDKANEKKNKDLAYKAGEALIKAGFEFDTLKLNGKGVHIAGDLLLHDDNCEDYEIPF